jgi:hypothetical protein
MMELSSNAGVIPSEKPVKTTGGRRLKRRHGGALQAQPQALRVLCT